MNKLDLVRSAVDRLEISRKDAVALIDGVFEDIERAVTAGEPVKIPGFGQFKVRDRAARIARNPATGEQVKVPLSASLSFFRQRRSKRPSCRNAVRSGARKKAVSKAPARKAPVRKAPPRKAPAARKQTTRKRR